MLTRMYLFVMMVADESTIQVMKGRASGTFFHAGSSLLSCGSAGPSADAVVPVAAALPASRSEGASTWWAIRSVLTSAGYVAAMMKDFWWSRAATVVPPLEEQRRKEQGREAATASGSPLSVYPACDELIAQWSHPR